MILLSHKNHCRSVVSFALACAVVTGGMILDCQTAAEAKSKSKKGSNHKKARRSGRIAGHNYLVPPPPPYAPSIMPELRMMANRGLGQTAHKEEKPKNEYPYSKYIYTAKKADAPRSVKLNQTTTAWN